MKRLTQFTLILFFLIILVVPLSWVFSGGSKSQESVVEARELVALGPSTAPNLQRGIILIKEGKLIEGLKVFIDLYINATFVEKFERATSDQFPFRMSIIQFSKALDRETIDFTYSFTDDPVIPADMKNGIYFDKPNNQLLQPVTLFNPDIRAQIDERITNYKDLIRENPDQNFYIFYHQTIHNSEYHPMAKYMPDADNGQAIEYFEDNLPEEITLRKFPLNGMDDHLNYYYRTDHHWNVYGMWQAYEQIYNMLKSDNPDISPMLAYDKIIKFPEIEFLGYYARLTFYPIEGDDFLVEVIDIPEHEMYFSGQKVEVNTREIYFEGDYSMIPYTNHFNEFYGNVTDLIEYNFENDSDRNLLIIGSSFRNALDPLLASHYNKTYCIDLRYNTDFDLSDFLSEHEVDDILIVGDNEVAFENVEYWKINP